MRNEILGAALFLIIGSQAASAPLEEGALYTNDWTHSHAQTLADSASALIRVSGYRCDSVSSIQRWVFSEGFSVVCNDFRYKYEIEDRGGRWTVTLQ